VTPVLRRHALAIGAVAVYLGLSGIVADGAPSADRALLGSLSASRTPALTELALAVTNLGDVWLLTIVSLLTVTALAFRSRRAAIFVASSVLGAAIIHYALKVLAARPRPSFDPVYEPGGWSFPSGHSMATFCFFVALALVVPARFTRARLAVFVMVAVTIGIVGLTRIYLGVHYPTDVLAGWVIGLAWVALLHSWYRREQPDDATMS